MDETLVNTNFETIARVITFSTRVLTGVNAQNFCQHANLTLYTKLLVLCATNKIRAHFFQTLDIMACHRDTNALFLDRHFKIRLFNATIFVRSLPGDGLHGAFFMDTAMEWWCLPPPASKIPHTPPVHTPIPHHPAPHTIRPPRPTARNLSSKHQPHAPCTGSHSLRSLGM